MFLEGWKCIRWGDARRQTVSQARCGGRRRRRGLQPLIVVDSRDLRMTSLLSEAEVRSRVLALSSAAHCRSSAKYWGAVLLQHLNTRTANPNLSRSGMPMNDALILLLAAAVRSGMLTRLPCNVIVQVTAEGRQRESGKSWWWRQSTVTWALTWLCIRWVSEWLTDYTRWVVQ